MENSGCDPKIKSWTDSDVPTESKKAHKMVKVWSNDTWFKFREKAEELAETTATMTELVKNEKAQYLAALESLRRCEDQLTVEKTEKEMFKEQRNNFIRFFLSSRKSVADLLVDKSELNRQVKETKRQLSKQININEALTTHLKDTKRLANQESRKRAASVVDFDELQAAFHQIEVKELRAQQELSKYRYDILLCKELIERLQKCVAELEDKVYCKAELEISLENSRKANLVLNSMLDHQALSIELKEIENQRLEQRCLSFEEIIESLQQKTKDLDDKYACATELAESHFAQFDKLNQAWDQALLGIETFNKSIKNCGSKSPGDSSLPETTLQTNGRPFFNPSG